MVTTTLCQQVAEGELLSKHSLLKETNTSKPHILHLQVGQDVQSEAH